MNSLKDIIDKWGSDKNLSNYTELYQNIFEPIREKELDLLEIGIGTLTNGISNMRNTPIENYQQGASLRAWQEYFPNAMIWGGDIAEDTQFEDVRIKTFLFNSVDLDECETALGDLTFDIIIDDGCHSEYVQMLTLNNLFKRVKPGGYYIIEDIERGNDSDLFKELQWKYKTNVGNMLVIQK